MSQREILTNGSAFKRTDGRWGAPTAGIPGYIMQSALSTVLYVIAGIAMDKLDIKTKLNGGSVL